MPVKILKNQAAPFDGVLLQKSELEEFEKYKRILYEIQSEFLKKEKNE